MIRAYSLMPMIMTALCASVAVFELLAWSRIKSEGYNFAFAIICVGAAIYNIACAGLYNITTPLASVGWLRMQAIALDLSILAFLWYVAGKTERVWRPVQLLVFGVGAFFILSQILAPVSWAWELSRPVTVVLHLPFGQTVTYTQVEPGLLTNLQYYTGIGFFIYLVRLLVQYYRSGNNKGEAIGLLLMSGIVFLAIMNDFAVSIRLYASLNLVEYAWLAVAFFVGLQRSRLLLEAAAARRALAENEKRYRAIFESLQDVYFRTDAEGVLQLISPSVRFFGIEPESVIGKPAQSFYADENAREALRQELSTHGSVSDFEIALKASDSRIFHVSVNAHSLFDERGSPLGIEGTIRDVSDRKKAEETVLASLQEKNVLLREIHHRVKNNLQVISSLLYLQETRLHDSRDKAIIQECRDQVSSMALIHEDLYRSEDFRGIDFVKYLKRLVDRLISAFHRADVSAVVPTGENIGLGIDKAIPCGLIVNELCTNALKHAFPGRPASRQWELRVDLERHEEERMSLVVADNGVGLPADFEPSRTDTLGMQIVQRLVKQLRGNLRLERDGGTKWVVEFPIR
ncbi:MAG TPA: histidine kinase dimerization/phosphoacceptor domain -containing protein [Spirochaetia bacterium]|nr:histidine kinase dimerization/phosphoacceptor domain -containing protein [Spirochaetia bacterium]